MVRYGRVWYDTVEYGTVRSSMVRYGRVWYGSVEYGMVRSSTVRYGRVRSRTELSLETYFKSPLKSINTVV